MKITVLSFLSVCAGLLFFLDSFSQKTTFKLSTDIRKGNLITAPFHSIDYSYFEITEKKKIHRLILNKLDSTYIFKTETDGQSNLYPNKECDILASITETDESLNAIQDAENNLLYFETVNLKTENYTTDGLIELKKEKIIGITIVNNAIIIVTHPKKEKFIKFYFKQKDKPLDIKKIDFSFLEEKTGKGKDFYSALDNATVIDYNTTNDQSQLVKKTKLFITKDKIIVIGNYSAENTHFFVADTAGNILEKKEFAFGKRYSFNDRYPDYSYTNSFYKDGKLFAVEVFSLPAEIRLYVYDTESGKLINKHMATNDAELSFRNAPVYQEGGSTIFSAKRKKQLEFIQFITKITNTDVFISAKSNSPGLTEVWVGSYKEIRQASAPVMMPSGGFGGGGIMVGGGFSIEFRLGFSSSWTKTTYMRSLFRNDDFSHQKGILPPTAQEKIDNYSDDLPNTRFSTNFRSISKEYLFYLNLDEKKIYITEFGD